MSPSTRTDSAGLDALLGARNTLICAGPGGVGKTTTAAALAVHAARHGRKVLVLTIEMRHQPFVLWIKDLSAPDPLHVLNLFGLLPFTPPAYLGIGVLAIILGVTMWAQFKLQPAAMDPAQQQIMGLMPWMMMFVMAPFASGLLLYWITSNLLTIGQQRYLYSRHPQLKAQAAKDQQNLDRAAARDATITAKPKKK